MSPDELRTVLHERAEVGDTMGAPARMRAVQRRVVAVRRRRRVVGAAAAFAAVVAAGASVVPTVLLRPAPNPADHEAPAVLAGRTVPRTETATGYTYDYVRGAQSRPGAGQLRLTVSTGSTPKLVMWATSSTDPEPVVRLTSSLGQHYRSAAGRFGEYVLVDPASQVRFTLSQRQAPARNRLALAVYDLDRIPPPGVSNGEVTFRQTILGARLMAGLIGKQGQADLRTTIPAPRGAVRISDVCYGAGSQDYVHVAINGQQILASGCSRGLDFDPGVDGASFTAAQNPFPSRGPARVHVWLTGKDGSTRSATPHAVIGFGLYHLAGDTFRLAGQQIPVRQESDGHEYVRTRVVQSRPGEHELTVGIQPSAVPRLVTIADSGHAGGYGMVQLLVGRSVSEQHEDVTYGGGGWSSGYVIQPGESPTLTLRMTRGTTGRTVLGIALSDQVH